MARPRRPDGASARVSLLLLLLLPAATATSYSSLCSSPAKPADLVGAAGKDQSIFTDMHHLPLPSDGYFFGGSEHIPVPRSFSLFTRRLSRTTNTDTLHLVATLSLSGYRSSGRGRHGNFSSHSVSFDLEGYYSTEPASDSGVLCMVGSGSRAMEDGSGVVVVPDVVLRLRLPRPASLMRPFVTGSLAGSDFGNVTLVAYANDDGDYKYGEASSWTCPPPPDPVRSARQVLDADLSCRRLGEMLRVSYALAYAAGRASSGSPLRQRYGSMQLRELYCDENDAVRAYMVFDRTPSDGMLPGIHGSRWWRRRSGSFQVDVDEGLVAEGSWDSSRSQLCLKACRTVRSMVREVDCGIGMNLWFPAEWSIHDRSAIAGLIRNTSTKSDDGDTNNMSGTISVSSTDSFWGNHSDIKYKYTRVEDAMKHYYSRAELSMQRSGKLPGNYSYRDFAFHFYMTTQDGNGEASPVTLGSAMVDGTFMADDEFSRHAVAEMNKQRLLSVSYELDVHLYRHVNSSRNVSRKHDRWRISAEGVYDTQSGSLCMVGCRVIDGLSDCEILVTVQFATLDGELGAGSISSLRKKNHTLFFETLEIRVYGAESAMEVVEVLSRMDMERIMLVSSMTLSCVFLLLQLRHAKKNPGALPATSITMLAVLALGYMIPLVLNFEAMFVDDGGGRSNKHFVQLASGGRSLELNELALRASTMVAFVLQLRLLQLSWSARSTTALPNGSRDEQWTAERSTLWICLPLYIAGALLIWIPHIGDGHNQEPMPQIKLAIDATPPALLSDDLVSYAGLIMDGFLLPQIVSNAFSGSMANAISPWFYVGGTAIRAAPHVYDGLRTTGYAQRWMSSTSYDVMVYAGPRDDLFSVVWDVVIPCGAVALAVLLFFQQRLGGGFLCCVKNRKQDGYKVVVSTLDTSA
ncbi:uncharacterized protein LOC102719919 [Oryza brachyantha]|uniref:uncharacterized protein LOC102719919 n=1 Tax=Oryza brachyantha TaxID=4533 RepID=UPI001ADCFF93|nr:uncharacterized protein LOC102719919 [Oryza brachyantha]